MKINASPRCIICDSSTVRKITDFGIVKKTSQSYYDNNLSKLEDGLLVIAKCCNCGHIQNIGYSHNTDYSQYNEQYLSSSSYSHTSQKYYNNSVKKIMQTCVLDSDSRVIEVGCGDGYFLSLFTSKGVPCFGYEPSGIYDYIPDNGLLTKYKRFFDFYNDYSACDLFILRHVLEHLEDPVGALKNIDSKYLFIEIPSADYLIENQMYSDFYYDHISYFTKRSIYFLLEKAGYTIIDFSISSLSEFYGVLSIKSDFCKSIATTMPDMIENINLYNFNENYMSFRSKVSKYILEQKSKGRSIVAWGAGARGITTLERLNLNNDLIDYIVDSDTRKVGKYVSNFSTEIQHPKYFYKNPPNIVLITAATFIEEIVRNIKTNIDSIEIVTLYPFSIEKHLAKAG